MNFEKIWLVIGFIVLSGCGKEAAKSEVDNPARVIPVVNPETPASPEPTLSFEELASAAAQAEVEMHKATFQKLLPGISIWQDGAVYDSAVSDFVSTAEKAISAYPSANTTQAGKYMELIGSLVGKVELVKATGRADSEAMAVANAFKLREYRKDQKDILLALCAVSEANAADCLRTILELRGDGQTARLKNFAENANSFFVIGREEYRQWGRQRSFDVFYNQGMVKRDLMKFHLPAKLANDAAGTGFTFGIPGLTGAMAL